MKEKGKVPGEVRGASVSQKNNSKECMRVVLLVVHVVWKKVRWECGRYRSALVQYTKRFGENSPFEECAATVALRSEENGRVVSCRNGWWDVVIFP